MKLTMEEAKALLTCVAYARLNVEDPEYHALLDKAETKILLYKPNGDE